ncbi:sarcosine oxidase subunit gamma [Ensifer soli]|uniref:sarcosine oxidase subunit gamma n=1 Tax=Ciceribacter sp. sgz301302 TaxID=3342379 RepID=UPI0035B83F61
MSLPFEPVHALDGRLPQGSAGEDRLVVLRRVAAVSVLAVPGAHIVAEKALRAEDGLGIRFVSPGEWLAVQPGGDAEGLRLRLAVSLDAIAHVIDQSDGRVHLRLEGPNARTILSKGIGIDFRGLDMGGSAGTLCGHIPVLLARTGAHRFELAVMRSFAESLLHDLLAMGREFGLSADFEG